MRTFSKKLEYRNWSTETATFLYKTVLSEVNVKTNKMRSTTKNGVLSVITLFFENFASV